MAASRTQQSRSSRSGSGGDDGPPAWLRRLVRPALLLAVAAGVVAWIIHMEGVGERLRLERELTSHPAIGPWFAAQRELTSSDAPGSPDALWVGEVARAVRSQPRAAGASQKLLAIELNDAILMAGEAGPEDDDGRVYIGVRDFSFLGPEPVVGETWMAAARRTDDGKNVLAGALLLR